MSNDRGVFTLGAYRRAQVEGQGVDLDDVWTTDVLDDAGYFAGGEAPSADVSRIDKIAYSTDTKSTLTSNISAPLRHMGSSSSPTAGYTMGGYNSSTTSRSSKIDKLTYATQTTSLIPGNFSDTSTYASAGGGSTTAGYLLQGSSPMVSYVRKITYATETIELLPGRVPNPVGNNAKMGSTGNGNTFLYVIGGSDGSGSEVKKLTYASDSVSNIPNMPTPGSLNRAQKPGCASSTEAAYIVGGSNPYNNRIDKITFSNDTCSYASMNSTVPVPAGRINVAGTGLPSAGYFAGGTSTSITEKITYSTNSIARIPALDLTSGVSGATGFGAKGDNHESPVATRWRDGFKEDDLKAGYYSGGSSNGYSTVTQKVDYATDQTSLVPGGNLPDGSGQFAGVNSNSVRTIMTGGEPSGNPFMQFVYATETASNLTGSMPNKRTLNNDMGYGTESVGYVTGGQKEPSSPSAYYSSTQKIEFATDTTSDVPGANSGWTMRYAGAFGNVDHTLGYVVGGQTFPGGPAISRIQKMTYSTETMANTPANMQNGYFNLGTTSGPDAGYIYSKQEYPGWTSNGAIEKFVYATDSRTTVPQPSYYPRYGANGTGNSTNGYYGGGAGAPSPSYNYRRLLKLNFSTGVGQDMPSSQFPYNEGVYRSAAGSAVSRKKSPKGAPTPTPTPSSPAQPVPNLSNDGYNVGGYWNSHPSYGNVSQSWIMKTSYSSDTTSLSPNKMIVGRNQFGTFSSGTAGYILGGSYEGWPSQQPATTNIQKVTYSNDTASTSPGQLAAGAQRGSGVSNPITGYVAGGIPAMGSRIQKYTFSTETLSAYIPAQLGNNEGSPSGLFDMGSAGNTTHGYFMGGDVPGNPSYMRRGTKIAYATDTADASQMFGDLQGARNFAAVGYANIAAYLSGREGGNSGSGNRSLLAKLTYSTDSITTIPSTTFNNSNGNYAGHGNETKGFFAGAGEGTRQYKLTYSTESLSLSPSNSWNFPSSVPGSGGPGAYDFSQGGAFSARNNDGGKVPVPVVF